MTALRALLDANILIGCLLAPVGSPIVEVVEAGILGRYTLLVPEPLIAETVTRCRSKPWLAERIAPDELAELLDVLGEVAEVLPRIADPIPAVTRDRRDDYLLAYALLDAADYLVTGDGDLLALVPLEGLSIVTAREFAEVLGKRALEG